GGEGEGAVADEVARGGPAVGAVGGVAVGFNRGEVDGIPGGVAEQGEEVGRGVFEGEAQGVVVGGGDADLGKVVGGAEVVGFGALENVEERGVGRGEGGGEHAADG